MPPKKKMTKEETLAEMRELKECGFGREHYSPESVDKEFLTDKDFLLEAVKLNGEILTAAPKSLQCDREILLTAAANSDYTLTWEIKLSKELLSDYEFMLRLVAIDGMFLRQWCFGRGYSPFTDEEKRLILTAVAQNYEAFDDVNLCGCLDYCQDKEFALQLVNVNSKILRFFGKAFRSDKDIILKAVRYNYQAFQFATGNLRNSEAFLLQAMEVNAYVLAFAPKSMREDRELVTRLMQKTPFVYRYAKGEMRQDVGLALQAVKGAPQLYNFLESELTHNTDFVAGLAEYADDESTPKDVSDFLKSRLKYNDCYRELRKKNPDLDWDLTQPLLADDVCDSFWLEYNWGLCFKNEIDKYIPEVAACFTQKQRGDWHIYNVMGHILHSVEEMNKLTAGFSESERKLLAFTMFFHDLGKPEYHKVKRKNGKLCDSFKGHNIGSEKIAGRLLKKLKFSEEEKKIILTLVREHDVFLKFADEPTEDWQVKPTAEIMKNYIEELGAYGDGRKIFDYLILVGIADNKAQNPEMTKAPLEMIAKIKELAQGLGQ